MNKINNPVIVYLVVSIVSLACATALFQVGGSLAEVTGNDKTLLGFTFKAGGAIAGFIIIFALSLRALPKLNEAFKASTTESLTLYRKELQELIYEGDFLKYTTPDFRKLAWKNLTNSLYKSSFPDLSENIENVIYEKFLPQTLDYYHKDAEAYYDIQNTADNEYVVIKETQKFTIVCGKNVEFKSIDTVYGLNDSEDKSSLEVTKFKVNGIDHLPQIKPVVPVNDGKLKRLSVEMNVLLGDQKKEYLIEKEIVMKHSRKMNVFWRRDIQRYTDSFQIGIQENTKLEVDLLTFGHNIDFKAIGEPVVKSLKKHTGLLLPSEGYIIFVK